MEKIITGFSQQQYLQIMARLQQLGFDLIQNSSTQIQARGTGTLWSRLGQPPGVQITDL